MSDQENQTAADALALFDEMEFSHVLSTVLAEFARRVTVINQQNGWFDAERTLGDDCMLLVSEAAEAFECVRRDEMDMMYELKDMSAYDVAYGSDLYNAYVESGRTPKPVGFPSELADILIRLADTAVRTETDLGAVSMEKLTFNATRGYRHGGKKL